MRLKDAPTSHVDRDDIDEFLLEELGEGRLFLWRDTREVDLCPQGWNETYFVPKTAYFRDPVVRQWSSC